MLRWMIVGLVTVAAHAATAREVRRPLPPRRVPIAARTNAVAKAKMAVKPLRQAADAGPACVDVLVAYDLFARHWAAENGGGMTNFAANAVARMNEAATNSDIQSSLMFRLAGVECADAVGGTDFDGTLDGVTYGTGKWRVVREARERQGADVTVTLIDTGSAYGTTGLSWALDPDGYDGFSEWAFSVCSIRAVAESHTMTHEVGHLMGAGHSDRQALQYDPGPLLYPYSSGYYFETNGVPCRTIMAYDDDGYGSYYEETPYFSTPNVALADVPVGTPTNDNARTLRETAAYVAGFRRPNFVCPHDDAAETWMPESGDICDLGKDGDVWQWCRACGRWVLDAAGFDSARPTYVICHGHANSIDETWIREMAEALPPQANVLAVNWGDGANPWIPLPSWSAEEIPLVVLQAEENLLALGVVPSLTTVIGHSHGGHVAANIVYDLGEQMPFKRFVGLETSTEDFGVHDGNDYPPSRWRDGIRNCAECVEFYKSSWLMSLSEEDQWYGHYNFVVTAADETPVSLMEDLLGEDEPWYNPAEIWRHGFIHDWFTATIRDPVAYAGMGFNLLADGLPHVAGMCAWYQDNRTVLNPGMPYLVVFSPGEDWWDWFDLFEMPDHIYCERGKVYSLPAADEAADIFGDVPVGWRNADTGRFCDPGILFFDLGRPFGVETLDAVWE